jgi:hypothetical protein
MLVSSLPEKTREVTIKIPQKIMHIQYVILRDPTYILKSIQFRLGEVSNKISLLIFPDYRRYQAFGMTGRTRDLQKPQPFTMLNDINIIFLIVLPTGTALYGSYQFFDQTLFHHQFPQ